MGTSVLPFANLFEGRTTTAPYGPLRTEDRYDGAFYRFVPSSPDRPFEGRLQAMRVAGRPRLDTGLSMSPGDRVGVDWVDIDDPEPSHDTVREQARAKGAAMVRRPRRAGRWRAAGVPLHARALARRRDARVARAVRGP